MINFNFILILKKNIIHFKNQIIYVNYLNLLDYIKYKMKLKLR